MGVAVGFWLLFVLYRREHDKGVVAGFWFAYCFGQNKCQVDFDVNNVQRRELVMFYSYIAVYIIIAITNSRTRELLLASPGCIFSFGLSLTRQGSC